MWQKYLNTDTRTSTIQRRYTRKWFCRAMQCISAICRRAVSVRLSVTFVFLSKEINILPSGSHTILVCPHQTLCKIPMGIPLTGASNAGGVRKIAILDEYLSMGLTCCCSLTCCCCKVMESIIKDQMLHYLLQNNLISKQQHGFLARRSTCSQLIECVNDWSLVLNTRNSVDCANIDFSKAFDTDSVVHSKLCVCKAGLVWYWG